MKDIKEHQKVLTCFFLLCPWIYCERASFEAFGENIYGAWLLSSIGWGCLCAIAHVGAE